jgi:glycosyltransferase involved in cell wall biosynthesis
MSVASITVGPIDQPRAARLAVIIPARNSATTLPRCLSALLAQTSDDDEVIVVDDYSTDNTAEVAARFNVKVCRQPRHLGISAARNRGVELTKAPVLFFYDSDVVLAPGALARARGVMMRPEVGALIGSYDDDPDAPTTISRFKNLAHHHFHQRSRTEASSFWGGCGMVRRDLFVAAGGFDNDQRTIEDVELGYRLIARGVRIVLVPDFQVKHLKKWTLSSLVTTDVFLRAIPWTLLWLQHRRIPRDLNFSADQRVAAIVAVALATAVPVAIFRPQMWLIVATLLVAAFWLNRDLYRLFFRRGGLSFAIKGFLLQQFYYLYSLFSLIVGVALYYLRSFARHAESAPKRTDHGQSGLGHD